MEVTPRLAAFAADLSYEKLPPDVIERSRMFVLDGAAVVGGSGWAVVVVVVVVAAVVVGSSKAPAGTTISVASSGVSTTMRLVPADSPPVPQAVTASTEKQATTTLMQSMSTPLWKSEI